MLKTTLLHAMLRMLSWLPLGLSRALGRGLGNCLWWTNSQGARVTRRNLEICFPELDEEARDTLAQKSLQHTGMAIAESGAIWLWPQEKTTALVHAVEGEELIRAARARGEGIVVIGPHLGNWELMGLYLTRYGPCTQLYQEPKIPGLGPILTRARSRSGAKMVPTNNKGVGALLAALKKGEMVGILPDQVPPRSGGDYAPFFGLDTLTMSLLPRLLQRTGSRALLAVAIRENGGFRVVFRAPGDDIYAEHMPTALGAMNRVIEDTVREMPEQYQWEYKRLRYLAGDAPSPYRKA